MNLVLMSFGEWMGELVNEWVLERLGECVAGLGSVLVRWEASA